MSWSGSQNYITGWAYEKTNSSIVEGKIGASADLYDGAELLINSTKPIWNAAGEKDVGVGAGRLEMLEGTITLKMGKLRWVSLNFLILCEASLIQEGRH